MSDDLDRAIVEALRSADRARPMTPEGRDRARSRALDAFDLATEERDDDVPAEVQDLGVVDPRDDSDGHERRRPRLLLAAAALVVVAVIGAAAWVGARNVGDVADVDVAQRPVDPDFVLGQQEGDDVLRSEIDSWCSTSLADLRAAAADWRSSPSDEGTTEVVLTVLSEAAGAYGDRVLASASPVGPQRLNELADYSVRLAQLRQDLGNGDVSAIDVQALLNEFDAELSAVSGAAENCEFLG